ncbi:MAG: hypothetical protein C4520_18955 [Candidatus Abyssobacteria bacterium SURF_5]|uniref:Right-handed parallel beta-helix repeat-containing protein n=1 Tax=Abyssobacteria bacterium (strain SURF_5) TaxID=2093360 RepID=A0A3A4NCM6_ABYX5|nr:MAG: hypothetical protein C4520_18955 [Candidatus Abyssubacteria bacterium SURF_5]
MVDYFHSYTPMRIGQNQGGRMKKSDPYARIFPFAALAVILLSAGLTTPATADHIYIIKAWNYGTLQLAINACESSGGGIVIADRKPYSESIVISSSNIVLQGQGKSTEINGNGIDPSITVSGTQVKICDLKVSSSGTGVDAINCTAADCEFENLNISDSDNCGFYIGGVEKSGTVITNCIVENTKSHALKAEQSEMRVSGCFFGTPVPGTPGAAIETVLSRGNHNIFTGNVLQEGSTYNTRTAASLRLDSACVENVVVSNVLHNGLCTFNLEDHIVAHNTGTVFSGSGPVTKTYRVKGIYDDTFAMGFWQPTQQCRNCVHWFNKVDRYGDLWAGYAVSEYHPFWRWELDIPVEAIIEDAYIKVKSSVDFDNDAVMVRLEALAPDGIWNVVGFSPYVDDQALLNISPRSEDVVYWELPSQIFKDEIVQSPPIAALVRARIYDTEYNPEDPESRYFGLRAVYPSTIPQYRQFYGVESSYNNANAADLVITYSLPVCE